MLSMYSWLGDTRNEVVAALQDEIDRLKSKDAESKNWVEHILCKLDEPVLKDFVDINGKETGLIHHKEDPDGYQRINFFLRTVRSTNICAAMFASNDGGMMDEEVDS
eukprot:13355334-Ditylum_brightwellii.AAC.1